MRYKKESVLYSSRAFVHFSACSHSKSNPNLSVSIIVFAAVVRQGQVTTLYTGTVTATSFCHPHASSCWPDIVSFHFPLRTKINLWNCFGIPSAELKSKQALHTATAPLNSDANHRVCVSAWVLFSNHHSLLSKRSVSVIVKINTWYDHGGEIVWIHKCLLLSPGSQEVFLHHAKCETVYTVIISLRLREGIFSSKTPALYNKTLSTLECSTFKGLTSSSLISPYIMFPVSSTLSSQLSCTVWRVS